MKKKQQPGDLYNEAKKKKTKKVASKSTFKSAVQALI